MIRISILISILFFLPFCNTKRQVKEIKEVKDHNYFALRDITLGKDNTIYLSTRSVYIHKLKGQEAFEKFQELHADNKLKRNYWKCKLKENTILECTEELIIKDISDEVNSK
jgi:hypothetical protein